MLMAAVGSGGGAYAGASADTSAGVVLRDPKDLVQDCLLLHQAPSLRAGNAVIVRFVFVFIEATIIIELSFNLAHLS